MENTETTIVENNAEVISQPIKKKSNKKIVIFTTVIAIVVLGIVATVIAIVAGNSNSLWKKPFDEESYQYGYSVTPEEFIEKANELYGSEGDLIAYKYEYVESSKLDSDADRYLYSITLPVKINGKTIAMKLGYAGLDFYQDNTIRQVVVTVLYDNTCDFDVARGRMAYFAVQLLYAYDAFGRNVTEEDLIAVEGVFKESFEFANEYVPTFFKYNDFILTVSSTDGKSAGIVIEKYDEKAIEEFEQNGANIIDLTE